MSKITAMTQYNIRIGLAVMILQKQDSIYSKFFPLGNRDDTTWTRWFSTHQNSSGFYLEFIY